MNAKNTKTATRRTEMGYVTFKSNGVKETKETVSAIKGRMIKQGGQKRNRDMEMSSNEK